MIIETQVNVATGTTLIRNAKHLKRATMNEELTDIRDGGKRGSADFKSNKC